MPGTLSVAGPSCPEGAYITGYDWNGNIVCSDGTLVGLHGEATVFRFSQLHLSDPHAFADFGPYCFAVQDAFKTVLNDAVTMDVDHDGFLDLSFLTIMRPLDQSVPGGAQLEFVDGRGECTAPMSETQCTLPAGVSPLISTYSNLDSGACLEAVPGTTSDFSSPVTIPNAPCFSSGNMEVTVPFAGFEVPLHAARLAATYSGSPAVSLENGLLRGFLTESDADSIILPPSLPVIGGNSLSSALRGGGLSICPGSDLGTGPDGNGRTTSGWWLYLNFRADFVSYIDDTVFLAIEQTDSPDPVGLGGLLTYTLVVSNYGLSDATFVTVTDTLPAGVTFLSATPTQGSCSEAGGNITCDVGNLAHALTATVSIEVTPTTHGPITNTARVRAAEADGDPANNGVTVTTTVLPTADLTITKDDGQVTAVAGASVTYTIVARNAGPSHVAGASVSDVFPAELTSCRWTCSPAGGATCTAGPMTGDINDMVDLPVGGTATYSATCNIEPSATGTLSNSAVVTLPPEVIDPDLDNNAKTDSDGLRPPCTFAKDRVLDGETISKTVTFGACRSITAGANFRIVAPGNVIFLAGQSVILADGFSVDSDATFTVEIESSPGGPVSVAAGGNDS